MDQVVPIINAHETRLQADLEVFRVVHKLHTQLVGGELANALAAYTLTPDKLDEGEEESSVRLQEVQQYIQWLRGQARRARGLVKLIVDHVLPELQRAHRLMGGDTTTVSMMATDEFLLGEENLDQAIDAFGRGTDELRTCTRIINAVQAAAADLPDLHHDTHQALAAAAKPPRKAALSVPVVKEFLREWDGVCRAYHALAARADAQLAPTRLLVEELCGCVHIIFE